MLRIPNASPSGLTVNFETKCSHFFHPRILVYILRNRASYLARNRIILNSSLKLSKSSFSDRFLNLDTTNYFKKKELSHSNVSHSISPNLEDELLQLSLSLHSCVSFIEPQSAATILLSFAKLNFFQKDLFQSLLKNFKFHNAKPKAVSLILYSISKFPISKDPVLADFFRNVETFIRNSTHPNSPKDLTTYLISISKIFDSYSKHTIRCQDILETLRTSYNLILNRITSIIKSYPGDLLNPNEPRATTNQHSTKSFSIFELSNILESFYIMSHYDFEDHDTVLNKLKLMLPSSIDYINDVMYIMNLFNITGYDSSNSGLSKKDKTNLIKITKKFSESCLKDLTDKLCLLTLQDLSKLTEIINRLRLWTDDAFFLTYTNHFTQMLNKHKQVIAINILVPILVYYNRRYESCINREYYFTCMRRGQTLPGTPLNEISNICGYLCDSLQDYFNRHYPSFKVDDLLQFTSKLRINRNLHTIKYNYKFN